MGYDIKHLIPQDLTAVGDGQRLERIVVETRFYHRSARSLRAISPVTYRFSDAMMTLWRWNRRSVVNVRNLPESQYQPMMLNRIDLTVEAQFARAAGSMQEVCREVRPAPQGTFEM